MRTLSRLLILWLVASSAASAQYSQGIYNYPSSAPQPNWMQPHWHHPDASDCQGPCPVQPTQLGYQFSFNTAQNQTSAKVYNAAGIQVRLLWSNEAYQAGTYYKQWDGITDAGTAATGGPFAVKVEGSNGTFAWALLGNTEQNWQGPNIIDTAWGSELLNIAWIGNKGYTASGYEEGGTWGGYFLQGSPNAGVYNWVDNRLSNKQPEDIATDGVKLYFVQPSGSTNTTCPGNYAWALYPSGQPYSFPQGTAQTQCSQTSNFPSAYYPTFSTLDTSPYYKYELTAAANASGGSTVYTGVAMTACASNGCAGISVLVTGFDNAANNGTFTCSASSTTSLTLSNANGVADTHNSAASPLFPGIVPTGIAVQVSGNYLAVAHGQYFTSTVSADVVRFWDKNTGASLGSVSVPNPQRMVFDGQNNLWVISGNAGDGPGNHLYKVTGVGSTNTVTDFTTTFNLLDPVSVAVSPTTGDLFVADGGTHEQIFEFNISTNALVSTLGKLGGFGAGAACNANIDPQGHNSPTLALDEPRIGAYLTGIGNGNTSFVSIDNNGDMWVGDFWSQRVMHYTWTGSSWNYVNRIIYSPWNYRVTMPGLHPTRVFSGREGFLEYSINYSLPFTPGDPDTAGPGTGWWEQTRNWQRCINQNVTGLGYSPAYLTSYSGASLTNGMDVLFAFSQNTFGYVATLGMQTSGTLVYQLQSPQIAGGSGFDNMTGNYFSLTSTGTAPSYTQTLYEYPVTSFTGSGLPVWGSATQIATYTVNEANGQPVNLTSAQTRYVPTADGNCVPVWLTSVNTVAPTSTTAFHFGCVPLNGTALTGWALPQNNTALYPTGGVEFTGIANLQNYAGLGGGTQTINNDTFALVNGNWGPYACQFFMFRDDMPLAQFGYQHSYAYQSAGTWGPNGVPQAVTNSLLAPGFCGDVGYPFGAPLDATDDVIVIGDEGYHRGTHIWKIGNLGSVTIKTGSGSLGTDITVQ